MLDAKNTCIQTPRAEYGARRGAGGKPAPARRRFGARAAPTVGWSGFVGFLPFGHALRRSALTFTRKWWATGAGDFRDEVMATVRASARAEQGARRDLIRDRRVATRASARRPSRLPKEHVEVLKTTHESMRVHEALGKVQSSIGRRAGLSSPERFRSRWRCRAHSGQRIPPGPPARSGSDPLWSANIQARPNSGEISGPRLRSVVTAFPKPPTGVPDRVRLPRQ
jgi:hypothetical protein